MQHESFEMQQLQSLSFGSKEKSSKPKQIPESRNKNTIVTTKLDSELLNSLCIKLSDEKLVPRCVPTGQVVKKTNSVIKFKSPANASLPTLYETPIETIEKDNYDNSTSKDNISQHGRCSQLCTPNSMSSSCINYKDVLREDHLNKYLWFPIANDYTYGKNNNGFPSSSDQQSLLGYIKSNFQSIRFRIRQRNEKVTLFRQISRIMRDNDEKKSMTIENESKIITNKNLLENTSDLIDCSNIHDENYDGFGIGTNRNDPSLTDLFICPNEIRKKSNIALCGNTKILELAITIKRIRIYYHPKFNEEEKTCYKLWLIYQEYISKRKKLLTYAKKLESLVSNATNKQKDFNKKLKQEKNDEWKEHKDLLNDIVNIISDILIKEEAVIKLESSLKDHWQKLQSIREKSGHQCTTTILEEQHIEFEKLSKVKSADNKKNMDSGTLFHHKILLSHISFENLAGIISWLFATVKENKNTGQNDYAQDQEKVIKNLEYICREDNGPIVSFILQQNYDNISSSPTISAVEQRRRRCISSEKYYVRVKINGKFVGKCNAVCLNWSSFSMCFNKTFNCIVLQKPRSIFLEVVRRNMNALFSEKVVCTIPVQIPLLLDSKIRYKQKVTKWYRFPSTKDTTREPKKLFNSMKGALLVSLILNRKDSREVIDDTKKYFATSRSKDYFDHSSPLYPSSENKLFSRNTSGFPRMSRLSFSLKDKSHEISYKLCSKINTKTEKSDLAFYFKRKSKRFLISEEPLRHRLLRIRYADPKRMISPIPLEEKVIWQNETYQKIVSDHSKQKKELVSPKYIHEGSVSFMQQSPYLKKIKYHMSKDDDSQIDFVSETCDRNRVQEYIQRVWDCKHFNNKNKKKPIMRQSEFVHEISYFKSEDEPSSFCAFLAFLVPSRKRSLRPVVKHEQICSIDSKQCSLLVTISNAKNLPSRYNQNHRKLNKIDSSYPIEKNQSKFNNEKKQPNDNDGTINSFVQVKFRDIVVKSRKESGYLPSWKQTLELPIIPSYGDFSQGYLQQIKESIIVTIFDEFSLDLKDFGGYYEDENTIVREIRYLGECEIPFHNLYMNGKIEGSFQLCMPKFCFGYKQTPVSVQDLSEFVTDDSGNDILVDQEENIERYSRNNEMKKSIHMRSKQFSKSRSYLNIILHLHPFFIAPKRNQNLSLSIEEPQLLQYARKWENLLTGYNDYTKKRKFRALVSDVNDYGWFISRYMKAQAPPSECQTMHQCAHFVKLIPFVYDWKELAGNSDMWCTHQQFLDFFAGNSVEHATLLAGYFMWLSSHDPKRFNADVFLVLGHELVEGETVS